MEAKKIEKFITILKIELKDLEEDLNALEETTKKRAAQGEITNFVSLGNLATIREEIMGIRRFLNSLDDLEPEKYDDIDDFSQRFIKYYRENLQNADLPESVYGMIERKIEKIKQFMQD